METAILSPLEAQKLLDDEINSASEHLQYASFSESTHDRIHWGHVQAFYQSVYNILWRCFGKDHRVVQHFIGLYEIHYRSSYDELVTLRGAAISAQKEIVHAIKYPESMKIFYSATTTEPSENLQNNRKIFVVHGRDEAKKIDLRDFLKKINTEPIILEDQPIEGKTVLDQFEHYANLCSFALILMTGDDFGGLYNYSLQNIFSTSKEEEMELNQKNEQFVETRARQNVITELGYFWGRLGLERLRILYEEGVAKPSDIDAVMYIKLDDKGLWKYKIARELDNKGIKIDMNLLDPIPE